MRITSESTKKQSALAASLQAEANGLVASGSFKAEFASSGFGVAHQVRVRSPRCSRWRDPVPRSPPWRRSAKSSPASRASPTIAAAAPVAYETELATYDTLPLPLPTPEEQEDFLLALVDAREKKLRYIQTRNDVEFARAEPSSSRTSPRATSSWRRAAPTPG